MVDAANDAKGGCINFWTMAANQRPRLIGSNLWLTSVLIAGGQFNGCINNFIVLRVKALGLRLLGLEIAEAVLREGCLILQGFGASVGCHRVLEGFY